MLQPVSKENTVSVSGENGTKPTSMTKEVAFTKRTTNEMTTRKPFRSNSRESTVANTASRVAMGMLAQYQLSKELSAPAVVDWSKPIYSIEAQ